MIKLDPFVFPLGMLKLNHKQLLTEVNAPLKVFMLCFNWNKLRHHFNNNIKKKTYA